MFTFAVLFCFFLLFAFLLFNVFCVLFIYLFYFFIFQAYLKKQSILSSCLKNYTYIISLDLPVR